MRLTHAAGTLLFAMMAALSAVFAPTVSAQQMFDAHQAPEELSPQDLVRYQKMTQELRCLVCQNQNIADSDAPLAADLREQLRRQIADGRSDAQITDYLTARYGDFVLYRPPFKPSTWLLWLGPFGVLLLALMVALRFARRHRAAALPPPAQDAERLRRLIDEERKS